MRRILIRSLLMGALLLAIPIYQVNAQETKQTVQAKLAEKQDKAEAEMTDYELIWKAIKTHGTVVLQISGKIEGKPFRLTKKFSEGEEPFLNAFEEELKPGVYNYQISFIPNELADDQNARLEYREQRTALIKKRKELLESGDRDAANQVQKEINELRKKGNETILNPENVQKKYDYINQNGALVVDENGAIKRFDMKFVDKMNKLAAEEAKKRRAENKNRDEDRGVDF